MSQCDFFFSGYPVSIMRRPYQRSIGVTVKPSGLIRVTVNKRVRHSDILSFLKECGEWIEKSQLDFKEVREKYPPKEFVVGESFLFMGKDHQLHFLPTPKKKIQFIVDDYKLVGFVPQSQLNPKVKEALLRFYEAQGRMILGERVEESSRRMKLAPQALTFRSQKTRWGSCSARGKISLNWKLIAAPLEVIDYVVVHELAHLKHQDHSQRFWNLVEEFCPNWKSHRRWLSKNQYAFDFLAKKSELLF